MEACLRVLQFALLLAGSFGLKLLVVKAQVQYTDVCDAADFQINTSLSALTYGRTGLGSDAGAGPMLVSEAAACPLQYRTVRNICSQSKIDIHHDAKDICSHELPAVLNGAQ
jgi:hypothetical protein